MATPSSRRQFIEAALSCTSRFALSYADPNQKWIIREHLTSLLQDFPSLSPSIDTFTHNDGTALTLLKANGEIRISPSKPPLSLTIWVLENYPIMPPIVYVNDPINLNHPFVDYSSGATTSSYLQNWQPGRSNLLGLVRNLVKLFSFNSQEGFARDHIVHDPSIVSKREAMDRLGCSLYFDMLALRSKTEEEIEGFSVLQAEMVNRADIATSMVIGLEQKNGNLKEIVKKLTDEADILLNWLKFYDKNSGVGDHNIDDAFEGFDEKSGILLDYLAEDRTMEDLMYALDEAVERGTFTFDIYIKQIRILARTQFEYRSKLIKLARSKT